jgi:NADPH2:quinone reductase
MRAIVIDRNGGRDVMVLREAPSLRPGPGQLLVELAAAGVNFRDVYEREGGYGRPAPLVMGAEGAGRVAEVGDGVEGIAVGARVAFYTSSGSYAEQALVEAGQAVPVPDGVDDDYAAAALLQGMTAHYLSHSTYPVQPGDTVLVHAAAGGTGLLLTQMVKLRGGRVIATTSSEEKAELARAAGADEVIGYGECATRVRELTGGEGVAAVYDGVGKSTFEGSLASLRPRGVFVSFGAASGPIPPVDSGWLRAGGSLYLTRPTLGDYTRTREELLARASDVFGWIGTDRLELRIGGRYPLQEARQALEDLEERSTTGKLVLLTR